jgi:transposase
MMGFKERTFAPLIAVSLEELVPQDHFYRHLHQVLDLSFVYDLVCESYSVAGRASIDPVVFFKLQLVMFFEDIRSERLLMRQVADRLSVRWYVGYDLDEPLPDHSTLSKIRTRYGLSVFRRFFEAIVEQCQKAKLIWGKDLYFDATKVEANASMESVKPRFAVEAHLAQVFAEEGEQECSQRRQEIVLEEAAPPLLPTALSETLREQLAATNTERQDWIEEGGRPNREETYGSYRRVADYRVSTTDPDATIMPTKGHGFHLGYHTHYVVDGGKKRIILNVLVTPSEVMENQPMLDLLWRTQFRWKLRPHQVTGDTTYGTLDIIQAVEDAHIRAYMPLAEPGERNSLLGIDQFLYDAEKDTYTCPQGEALAYHYTRHVMSVRVYRADAEKCDQCPLKSQCTTSSHGRTIHRNLREHYSERVRAYHQTAAYEKAMGKRKVWVEPLFAEAKQWHGARRFRLRQLWRVNCEALVIASGQNLKRLLQKRGWGRRPFPTQAVALMPPGSSEAETLPRNPLLKNQRASVAVASLASWELARMFSEAQTSRFSLLNIVIVVYTSFFEISFFAIFHFSHFYYWYFPIQEKLCAFKLMCSCRNSAKCFSTDWGY